MTSLTLSEAAIRAGATEKSFARGRELFRRGAVSRSAVQGRMLSGVCEGSEAPFYRVCAELDEGGVRSASCTCPYDFGGYCKHVIALLLSYAYEPGSFAVRKAPEELLSALSREQLLALLTRLLGEQPNLYELIETALAAPSVSGGGKTALSRHREMDVEVYRRRVSSIMHGLDHMRASEAYCHVSGLTDELRGVERSAREFLDAGEAEAALRILLTLVGESSDGFEYVDDSNGELGDFLNNLGATLAEVILSLDLDEDEREDLVSDLDDLHDRLSDYGVEGLSVAILAVRHGWEELPASARPSETRGGYEDEYDDGEAKDEWYASEWAPADPVQVLIRAKLNVLERQGRTDDYLALCLRAGEHLRYTLKLVSLGRASEAVSHALKHLTDAGEALTLAQRLRDSAQLDEALRIGERGLRLKGHKATLGRWLGAIEEMQGRTKQALEAWLAAFREAPSLDLWRTLKRLAGRGWPKLKPKAMSSLEKFYDKRPFAEVVVEEQEWDAAIRLADRHAQEHEVTAIVADALITRRPEWVIRASVNHAEALIAPTKSSLYPAAADWLRRAKAAYAHSGRLHEWQQYVQQLKEQYKRRPALMAQLKSL
ncbi:MAG TPA: SWIM zinc finger family protein [Pyrinomonadaceae bacterium]|jgi:uncharacterized Zn finger protein